MVLLGISTQTHIIDVSRHFSPSRNQLLYKMPAPQYIQTFFISSWKSAGALATPKAITSHLNTRLLGLINASIS